jgi:VanZ family protein
MKEINPKKIFVKMKKLISKRMSNFFLPPFIWAGFIFILSSMKFSSQGGIPGLDKVAHFIEYFVLTILVYRLLFSGLKVEKNFSGYFTYLLVFIFSVTDEFHQSFVPTREVSLFDILSDTIGATAAIFSLWKLLPKVPKRLFSWARKLDLI